MLPEGESSRHLACYPPGPYPLDEGGLPREPPREMGIPESDPCPLPPGPPQREGPDPGRVLPGDGLPSEVGPAPAQRPAPGTAATTAAAPGPNLRDPGDPGAGRHLAGGWLPLVGAPAGPAPPLVAVGADPLPAHPRAGAAAARAQPAADGPPPRPAPAAGQEGALRPDQARDALEAPHPAPDRSVGCNREWGTLVLKQLELDRPPHAPYAPPMPRQARLDAPGALHHVMARGIARVRIFRTETDREDFLARLAALCQAGAVRVYAWALLPTHFHLLVRSGRQPLAHSMRRLLTGYVVNYNRRHKRYGHLFQNRYKSIICEEDAYLLELTRYIHLNPLRAGLVATLGALRAYPWTGHATLMGRRRDSQRRGLVGGALAPAAGERRGRGRASPGERRLCGTPPRGGRGMDPADPPALP